MFRNFHIFVTILLVCVSLLACAGKTRSRPSWIDNPGNGAVGSSTTHVKGRYYQEELAIARARERLAARYGVEVSSIQTIKETVANDKSYVHSQKEILQQVKNATVKARVRARWRDLERDEIYVWVYPIN